MRHVSHNNQRATCNMRRTTYTMLAVQHAPLQCAHHVGCGGGLPLASARWRCAAAAVVRWCDVIMTYPAPLLLHLVLIRGAVMRRALPMHAESLRAHDDKSSVWRVSAGCGTHHAIKLPHLRWNLAHPANICPATAARPCHISAGTRLATATSAQGLGLAAATTAPGLGSPLPYLHRDWAHPCHICTGTGAHLRTVLCADSVSRCCAHNMAALCREDVHARPKRERNH